MVFLLFQEVCSHSPYNPVDTGRKLNAHKTFRKRQGRLLNVLCTFNFPPVSMAKLFLTLFVAVY